MTIALGKIYIYFFKLYTLLLDYLKTTTETTFKYLRQLQEIHLLQIDYKQFWY